MPEIVQPLSGSERLLLAQAINDTTGSLVPGFQTESSFSSENELKDEQTKQGRILAYGDDTESFDATFYVDPSDAGQNAIKSAKKNKEQIKIWEADTVMNENSAYNARFAYCLVESIEESASDSFVELSVTLQVIGQSQDGELTSLPAGATEAAQYSFEEPTTGP